MKAKILIGIGILILIGLFSGAYVVDETEQVVVTQFGRPIGSPKTEPGLYFKIPVIQQAHYFPKNLLEWDGDADQIPTLDKTFIYVDTFARWKIVEPLLFFQTVNDIMGAQARLDDILDSAVRNLVTSHPLIETVRWTNRKLDTFEFGSEEEDLRRSLGQVTLGRQQITHLILEQAQPKVRRFGIEIVDVQVKRLNYVEQVRKSVYGRMIAERKRMAEKFRSEGRGEANKIEGLMEKELKRIRSEAYKTAQEVKGKADAEAAQIYASAYGKDPEFYYFTKTLEVYGRALGEDSSLILSTDSDLFGYFQRYTQGP